jgi:RHS repeat-associated protein
VGHRIASILPLGQRAISVYDAVGNLSLYSDFNGNLTSFSYDPLNRLTYEQYSDGSFHSFTYTPMGQRATVTDGRGVTTYTYNERDWLLSRIDPDGRSISYTYDSVGNRTSLTTASGTINYTFNERNWLDLVTQNGVMLADYDYNAVGNLTRTQFANGAVELRLYDSLNLLTNLTNQKLNGDILSSYTYTLDKVGNRLQVLQHNGRQVNYAYDDLYRLTQEQITDTTNGNRTYAYDYDKVSNRLTKSEIISGTTTTTGYIYDANDRLLTESVNGQAAVTYTYDNNGSTLTKTNNGTTTTYNWNTQPEARMAGVTVTDANGVVQQQMSYQYDADGMHVSATVNGEETRYLLDTVQAYPQVLEEYAPDATVKVSYIYGNDLISQTRSGGTAYYLVDGLGSTRVLTDTQGQVITSYNYEAFGEMINSTGSAANSYLFAGERFDNNLGNYYLRQRFYDQRTGRFIRRDSFEGIISTPTTLHKYIYANANPVIFTDPLGYFSLQEFGVAARIAATLSNLSIAATYGILKYRTSNGSATPNERRWVECMDGHFTWALALLTELAGAGAGGIPKVLVGETVREGANAFTSLARTLSVNGILRPYSTIYANWLKGRLGIFRGTGIKPAAIVNVLYFGASAYVLYTAISCAIKAISHGDEQ